MLKKICLITGATSGLGKKISIKLSEEGYKLILVSRSKFKLRDLSKKIINKKTKFFAVDLSNIQEVKRFVKKISSVDILINNAGDFYFKKEKNQMKFNKTMILNYYTPYYLIYKLIINKKIKKKLVINISSRALLRSKISISKINNLAKYNGWEIYKFSKLLMFIMSNYFSKFSHNVQFVSLDPGRMRTNFGSSNFFLIRNLVKLYLFLFGQNPNKVVSKLLNYIKKNQIDSKYIINKKIIKFYNLNLQKNLFTYTNKALKINNKNKYD